MIINLTPEEKIILNQIAGSSDVEMESQVVAFNSIGFLFKLTYLQEGETNVLVFGCRAQNKEFIGFLHDTKENQKCLQLGHYHDIFLKQLQDVLPEFFPKYVELCHFEIKDKIKELNDFAKRPELVERFLSRQGFNEN